MTLSVLVWDQPHKLPATAGKVLLWRSYARGPSIISIPRYLEDHAERLRQRYLAFIHDLGQSIISGRRVVDHLDLGDGFSFWWMTLVAEKSPLKSPRIYTCLRLLALEEILSEERPQFLSLVSADSALARAMRRLCRTLGIGFRYQRRLVEGSGHRLPLRALYGSLPYFARGLLSLRHALMRLPLRGLKKPSWFSGEKAVFVCSYFIHLDPTLCAQGQFQSRQWEGLPKLLHVNGKFLNWIQIFLFSKAVPDYATGLSWLRGFNRDAAAQGSHIFLDSYATWGNIFAAIRNWLWLCTVSWRLWNIQSAFHPKDSAVWLWPVLRDDWQSSLCGPVGLDNCLWIGLFDAALADMPYQAMGLYLCENQGWEKALLRAWRKHGHGEIIGVQHSTVPFWHLYNFDDPRSLESASHCPLPLPNRLAVNGAAARQAFLAANYPAERLVNVEALRYLNLSAIVAREDKDRVKTDARTKVLVLADMIPASTRHLMGLLQEIAGAIADRYQFTVKPHPGYRFNLADYPDLQARETNEALGQVLGDYDVAVAANSTSAAVDAYIFGLPVIIGLDGNELNLSPLRGRAGLRFVSDSGELLLALETASQKLAVAGAEREQFFFMERDLPRWKQLLAIAS